MTVSMTKELSNTPTIIKRLSDFVPSASVEFNSGLLKESTVLERCLDGGGIGVSPVARIDDEGESVLEEELGWDGRSNR